MLNRNSLFLGKNTTNNMSLWAAINNRGLANT